MKLTFHHNMDQFHLHQLNCRAIEESGANRVGKMSMNVSRETEIDVTGDEEVNVTKVVDYKLNKKAALAKKLQGCDRVKYDPVMHANCCVLTFSTAAFEVFRKALSGYLDKKSEYAVKSSVQKDQDKNIPQDTITVKVKIDDKNFEELPPMYTINLYRTTGRVMVNGPFFRTFVNQDLPFLEDIIMDAEDLIDESNACIKESLTYGPAKSEQMNDIGGPISSKIDDNPTAKIDGIGKRTRKKKIYDDFEVNIKRTRSSAICKPSTEKLSVVDEENWTVQPKLWHQYGYGEWNDDIAKECNKRKGCLKKCGKNNSNDMVRCDGCGRWCHFRCMDEKLIQEGDDYICGICQLKVDRALEDANDVIVKKDESIEYPSHDEKSTAPQDIAEISLVMNDAMICNQKECSVSVVNDDDSDQFKFNVFMNDMITWYEKEKENGKILRELTPSIQSCKLSNICDKSYGVVYGPKKVDIVSSGEGNKLLVRANNDMHDGTYSGGISANTLEIIKGHENEDLFAMIYKQKNKIMELKSSNITNSVDLPMKVLKQLNFLVQIVEKKAKENNELLSKNKQFSAEMSEIKRSKKVYMDENIQLKNALKNKTAEASQLSKQCTELELQLDKNRTEASEKIGLMDKKCSDLLKELDSSYATSNALEEIELKNAAAEASQLSKQCAELELELVKNKNESSKKIELINKECTDLRKELDNSYATCKALEEKVGILTGAAGDVLGSSTVEVVMTNREENNDIADQLDDLSKKYTDLTRDNAVLTDSISEIKLKYARLDNYYQGLIETKDKAIKAYLEISDSRNLDTNFRRLLMNFKAEKELQFITQLKESLKNEDEGIVKNEDEGGNHDIESDSEIENSRRIPNSRCEDPKLLQFIKDGNELHNGCNGSHRESELRDCFEAKSNTNMESGGVRKSNTKKLCWFGTLCFRGVGCTFEHTEAMNPPKCRFDLRCHRDECVYKHSNDCSRRVGCTVEGCNDRHVIIKHEVSPQENMQAGNNMLHSKRNDTSLALNNSYTADDWSANGQESSVRSKHVYPVKRKMYVESAAQEQHVQYVCDYMSGKMGQESSMESKHVYPVKRKMCVQSVFQDQHNNQSINQYQLMNPEYSRSCVPDTVNNYLYNNSLQAHGTHSNSKNILCR